MERKEKTKRWWLAVRDIILTFLQSYLPSLFPPMTVIPLYLEQINWAWFILLLSVVTMVSIRSIIYLHDMQIRLNYQNRVHARFRKIKQSISQLDPMKCGYHIRFWIENNNDENIYIYVSEIIWEMDGKTDRSVDITPIGNMVGKDGMECHGGIIEPLEADKIYSGTFKITMEMGKESGTPQYIQKTTGTFRLMQCTNIPGAMELETSYNILGIETYKI